MRIDKFLKVSRLIKRRTLAKEVCDQGRVQVNDRVAKAGTEVNVGDTVRIRYGQKVLEARIEVVAENVRKEHADQMYTVLSEAKPDQVFGGTGDED